MSPKKYLNPRDVKSGDTVYDEDGKPHTVEDSIGNMIYTTDGFVEIIPPQDDDDDE